MDAVAARFRRTTDFFWQYPLLWTPALLADAFRFVFYDAVTPLRRAIVAALIPRSVLGGYAGGDRLPMLPLLVGSVMEWVVRAGSVYLFLCALTILVQAVPAIQRGASVKESLSWKKPVLVWRTLGFALAGYLVALALIATAGYFGASSDVWLAVTAGLPAVLLLYALIPALGRFINANCEGPPRRTPTADFLLLLTGIVGSLALEFSILFLVKHDEGLIRLSSYAVPWTVMMFLLSLVSTLPYAFTMIGLSLRGPQLGLFIYGTLHPNRAPAEISNAVARLTPLGAGTVSGELLNLGEYPGLILDGAQNAIQGEVFAFDSMETLAAIDAYEGYDEAHPEASLFMRTLLNVEMGDGRTEEHWAYVYARNRAASHNVWSDSGRPLA